MNSKWNLMILAYIAGWMVIATKTDAQCNPHTCNPQLVSIGFTPGTCFTENGTRILEMGWFMNSTGPTCVAPPGSLRLQISLPLNGVYESLSGVSDIVPGTGTQFDWTYSAANRTFNGVNNVAINRLNAGIVQIVLTGATPNACVNEGTQANFFTIPNILGGCQQAFNNNISDDALIALLGVQQQLPIALKDFSARNGKCGQVIVEWETASEINSDYIEIERSEDGLNYGSVARVISRNSSGGARYSYTDETVLQGTDYLYRLRSVDFDGRYEVHPMVSVLTSDCSDGQKAVQLYPNPTFERLNVALNGYAENETIRMVITNVTGEIVMTVPNVSVNAVNEINLHPLAPGVYNLMIVGHENISTKRFIKVDR